MGYFSNSSEGMSYEAFYCDNCVHFVDGACPIWDLHFLHNGEEQYKHILDALIPRDDKGENLQCKLFIRKTPEQNHPTLEGF